MIIYKLLYEDLRFKPWSASARRKAIRHCEKKASVTSAESYRQYLFIRDGPLRSQFLAKCRVRWLRLILGWKEGSDCEAAVAKAKQQTKDEEGNRQRGV